VGAVSVLTLPSALVRQLSAEGRAALHRGRYAVHAARMPEEANGIVRGLYGPGLHAKPMSARRPLHPKAAATVVVRSPKLVVVSDPGIEDEAQALFITGKSLAKTPVPPGAVAIVVIGENPDLTEALLPHVRLAAAPRAGDAGDALAEAMASEARVVVLDREALGFAVLALPERVERGPHRVTVAVMSPPPGEAASLVELARKLDAPALLLGTAVDGSAAFPEETLLAGLLNQAGIPCHWAVATRCRRCRWSPLPRRFGAHGERRTEAGCRADVRCRDAAHAGAIRLVSPTIATGWPWRDALASECPIQRGRPASAGEGAGLRRAANLDGHDHGRPHEQQGKHQHRRRGGPRRDCAGDGRHCRRTPDRAQGGAHWFTCGGPAERA